MKISEGSRKREATYIENEWLSLGVWRLHESCVKRKGFCFYLIKSVIEKRDVELIVNLLVW